MYFPPAISDFDFSKVARQSFLLKEVDLDAELCTFFGSLHVVSGNSWVKILARTFGMLGTLFPEKKEVVLPAYSCNEFTKAILLADLEPKFIDFSSDFQMDLAEVEKAVNSNVLAVISVNNIGVESDNQSVKELCHSKNTICFEDATYTYFGKSSLYPQQKFGTFGDFSILNFSEGKTIPVGGGAVLLNNKKYQSEFENLRKNMFQSSALSVSNELKALAVYKAGASKVGYDLYRRLKNASGVDFKNRLSMEPSRAGQVSGDLMMMDSQAIVIEPNRRKNLETISLRPLGLAKKLCGLDILKNFEKYNSVKKKALRFYKSNDKVWQNAGRQIELPDEAMLVKVPFVFHKKPKPNLIKQLNKWGMAKQYLMEWPMYQLKEYKNSRHFYECTYTLPVHKNSNEKAQKNILNILENV